MSKAILEVVILRELINDPDNPGQKKARLDINVNTELNSEEVIGLLEIAKDRVLRQGWENK